MRAPTLALILALVAAPALAGQPVSLKPQTVDADGLVTLGDLFDAAGPAAEVAVARREGVSVVLDAGAVQAVARRAGLDWANSQGLRRIVVTAGASTAVAARGNIEVLTYARSLAVGEVVQPQDLIWAKAAAAPMDAPRDPDAVIGMTARRPLREGAAVSQRDVAAAQVIKTGDMVTVTYVAEGISLSLQGKALASAAVGEPVLVLNPASKKTLQAVAAGPGQALIGPEAQQLRPLAPAQIALR